MKFLRAKSASYNGNQHPQDCATITSTSCVIVRLTCSLVRRIRSIFLMECSTVVLVPAGKLPADFLERRARELPGDVHGDLPTARTWARRRW